MEKPTYKELEKRVKKLEKEKEYYKCLTEVLSFEREKHVYENSPDAIIVLDRDRNILYANKIAENVTGVSCSELKGEKCYEAIIGRSSACDGCLVESVIKEKKAKNRIKHEITTKGNENWLWQTWYPLLTPEGEVESVVEIAKNITDLKKTEKALQESEERYRSLVENINLGIVLIDARYNVLMANKALGDAFNKKATEFVGKKCFEEFEKRQKICEHCPGTKAMVTGLPQEVVTEGVRDDGSRFSVWNRSFPTFGPNGEISGFIEVVEDITVRRKIEEEKDKLQSQLIQAQKIESVGRLAGGVAHDFNNILSAINGYAELTLAKIDQDSPLRKNIDNIRNAGIRAANLTQQLLAFSRKQIIQPGILNLNRTVEDMQSILDRLIGENIEVNTITCDELWNIKADSSQTEQMIMNLAVNAKEAMPKGGKLTIETENVAVSRKYAKDHYEIRPGEYVLFAISDTGHGIPKEIQQKIFEPFFTTKENEKGTGLGLATVYGIIKQNNGFINVYSEPDKGSTFKVYWPRTEEEIQNKDVEQSYKVAYGTETVLVVEDEKIVRELAVEVLSGLGYLVLEAEDGEDGLNICKKYHGKIDLILTDVVMPNMSAKEFLEQVKECYGKSKVLYMSGYTENTIVNHGVLKDGINFLPKPITPTTLADAVRKVLDDDKIKKK